jgi:iron complex transport system permease protein
MIASETVATRHATTALWLAFLTGAFGVAFALDLAFGSVRIPLSAVLTVLSGGTPAHEAWKTIVLQFRLPKAVMAALGGAALGTSGLQMQTLFGNPLAGPFVLGLSSGASLGVALTVLTVGASAYVGWIHGVGALGDLGIVAAATAGAAAVLFVILVAARYVRGPVTLLLLGLMVGYVAGGVVNILIYFSAAEQIQTYVLWTAGSFGGVSWEQLGIVAPVIGIALATVVLTAKPLNVLLLGEGQARALGLHVERTRYVIIGSTAVLAGSVTAFCGPIAFLDIAVPHLGRGLLRTSDHRDLVPVVALLGAIVALVADMITQLPPSGVILPLNAITAIIGAPVVATIILRRQRATLSA